MSMEYVRKFYGVPAKRGGKIRFTDSDGKVWEGRIKSARGPHIRCAMKDFPRATAILHPTWNVEYL